MNYVIVDVETTGGHTKDSKITELAMYKHDGKQVIDHFQSLVDPEQVDMEIIHPQFADQAADNGPGFPVELLPRIFEPYVTTKPRGTGLGLAVVKKIADEHGARIELGNIQEQGVVQGAQVSLSFAVAHTAQGVEQIPS